MGSAGVKLLPKDDAWSWVSPPRAGPETRNWVFQDKPVRDGGGGHRIEERKK